MNFRGYKIGGLYKLIGASPRGARACQYTDIDLPRDFNFVFIPNNAIIMFLERLDDDVGRDDDVHGVLTDLQKELLEKLKITEWDIAPWRSSFSRGWDR